MLDNYLVSATDGTDALKEVMERLQNETDYNDWEILSINLYE